MEKKKAKKKTESKPAQPKQAPRFQPYYDGLNGNPHGQVVAENATGWRKYADGTESYPYGPGIGGWRGY